MTRVMVCFRCSKSMPLTPPVGRSDVCPHCGADVRVCRNCQFYEPTAYNECREPVADRVKDKERANFCSEFRPRKGKAALGAPTADRDDLLAQARKLFK